MDWEKMRLLEIILFIFAITYTILFYVGYFKRIIELGIPV